MIGLPPSAGGVHVTVADPGPAVARTPVGAPGTAAGVTAAVSDEAAPVPTALTAATVNRYEVPLVSPSTVAELTGPRATVRLPTPSSTVTT